MREAAEATAAVHPIPLLHVYHTHPTDGSAAILAPLAADMPSAAHAPMSFSHLHGNSLSPMALH
eukprot:3016731-Amphidinium_carterae.1